MRRVGAWARGRVSIAAVSLAACAYAPMRLCAQTPDSLAIPRVAPTIRYGKWLALGGSLAAAFLADQRHRDANAQYDALQSRCDATPSGCVVSGGRYVDPVDEGLYQDTRRLDHQAARYLVGAEALFAASAAGFVWELMHHHDEPRNIPFAPRVERSADRVQLGMSVRF